MRATTFGKIRMGLGVALLVFLLSCAVLYQCIARLERAAAQRKHAHAVLLDLKELLSQVTAGRYAAGAFVINGEATTFDALIRTEAAAAATLDRLRSSVSNDPDARRQLDELVAAINAEFARLRSLADTRRRDGAAAAGGLFRKNGSAAEARINNAIEAMENDQYDLVAQYHAAVKGTIRTAVWAIGIGCVVTVSVVVAAGVSIHRGIRRHDEIQTALRTSENDLAEAQHLARLGNWNRDLQTGRVTWSRELLRIFGLTEAQFGGTFDAFLDTVHPDDRDRVRNEAEHAVAERRPLSHYFRISVQGEERVIHVRGAPVLDEAGNVVRLFGTAQDVTDMRRAESALRLSEARLNGILQSAMDAIITINADQRIVFFNAAAEKMFRCRAAQAVGAPIERFIPERFRATHAAHIRRFGETGITSRTMGALGALSGLRADGEEFPIEASISQVTLENEKYFSVILRDISQRKQLEEQLLHAQKMEGIGRLAGGVAHDFNNWLTAIFGYLELARDALPQGNPAHDFLAGIREAAERAAALTNQLLAFARKQIIEPRIVDLGELVGNVERLLSRLLGEDIRLHTRAAPDAWSVRIDPSHFEQIIVNLAVNARDAMPCGGTLSIEVQNVLLDDGYTSTHPEVAPGEYVLLAVSDTGHGMDAAVQQHIFEPFFTTKDRSKGTGLGLATVHGVVKQHGGHIWLYSEPGKGTTFKIYLPRAVEDQAAAASAPPAAPSTRGTETVLIVEDEPLVRWVAAQTLRNHGYTVLEAAGGDEALKLAASNHDKIDLVMTDVVMPGMSGQEVASALRERRRDLKVLFASGYTEDTISHHGVLDEGVSFIPKPYTPSSLARRVREVLDA
ncbi:MAG: PAS domain S-box protein [Phycisphaerae bacterium]|nr:PAS domain S-box protein [Phycisphaerae bacterium]NUQ47119.1 PAS domain S-box protein [Phycisphaerae bacterium]